MTDAPIAEVERGVPSLYGALGAIFHLEELVPDDTAMLGAACDAIWDWIGSELHFTHLSVGDFIEDTKRRHLEYISEFPTSLIAPKAAVPEHQAYDNALVRGTRTSMHVYLRGGTDPGAASPFSVRFWGEVGPPPDDAVVLPGRAVLHVTVPESYPLPVFHERIMLLASCLRLRWGAAGYVYSPLGLSPGRDGEHALFAHARRHVGYDAGWYMNHLYDFFDSIRTISWLTFIGPALTMKLDELTVKLEEKGKLPEQATLVETSQTADGGLCLRAGAAPERGDVNRLWIPPAYREADTLLRPIRSTGERIELPPPWEEEVASRWFKRFELRVV